MLIRELRDRFGASTSADVVDFVLLEQNKMLICQHISVHVLEIEKRSAFIEISIYRIYQHLSKSVKRNISLKIRNHEKTCFFMAAVQGHFSQSHSTCFMALLISSTRKL